MARKKILIVDDDENILDLLSLALQGESFEVLTAENGTTGLEQVFSKSPDLIFLDVMLPKMSGWEICRIIKEDPRSKDIPVVMLTSLGEIRDKVTAIQLGADDYVTKPFEISEILQKVQRILSEPKN